MTCRLLTIGLGLLLMWPLATWAMTPLPSPLVSSLPAISMSPSPTPQDRSIEAQIFAPALPFVTGVKNVASWLVNWFTPSHLKVVYCDSWPLLSYIPYLPQPQDCTEHQQPLKVPLKAGPNPTYSPGRKIF